MPVRKIAGMPTTVGVNCSAQYAFVAIAKDGVIVEREPERLELPATELSERLAVFVDDTARELQAVCPDRVSVLRHEHLRGMPVQHSSLESRVVLETLVRLAAVKAGIPVELTHRQTVRARLGFKGKLEEQLDTVLPQTVGQYWRAGRGLAAMAALALQKQ
jgi:hypothetical protein